MSRTLLVFRALVNAFCSGIIVESASNVLWFVNAIELCLSTCFFQELRSREEELTRAALQQKSQEELLKRREQQLAEREIDVLERELNILIFQLNKDKPNVKKRKGKFKRSRLKLKDGNRISLPSGER